MNIKLYVLTLWLIIDPIYFMFTRLVYIDGVKGSDRNIFRVRLTRYKGKESILSDGTVIQKNDLLIKIHLHNAQLMKSIRSMKSDVRKAMVIHQSVEKSLPQLADYVNNHSNATDIKGIIGITMLNRGSSKLGFDSIEISSPFYKYFKCIALLPIYWLSVNSLSSNNLKKHHPCYLFMSKDRLLQKYFQQMK